MPPNDRPMTVEDFKQALAAHEERENEALQAVLEKFMSAFPGGDPEPHCAYHQSKIDAAKAEREFWQAAKLKLVEQGVSAVFGALRIITLMVAAGLLIKLGIKLPEVFS